MNELTTAFQTFESPLGFITVFEKNENIIKISFNRQNPPSSNASIESTLINQQTPLLREAISQLKAYFKNQRQNFNLPLQPQGTSFQKKAWRILTEIPYGQTISYSEQALKIGGDQYRRAVGQANGKNPIAIVIPCHRVIGKNGKLTGYASGLDIKKRLLLLEGIDIF